jgi:hypothetical protein
MQEGCTKEVFFIHETPVDAGRRKLGLLRDTRNSCAIESVPIQYSNCSSEQFVFRAHASLLFCECLLQR